jgi:hypothetical protein
VAGVHESRAVWIGCFCTLLFGVRLLWADLAAAIESLGLGREAERLRAVSALLLELEETLSAGLVPAPERWEALRALPRPWGVLAFESLSELRAQGGSLLPTLKRLGALAAEHTAALSEGRARASSSVAQALACAGLVPLFGGALYLLVPGVEERPWLWLGLCGGALGLALGGAGWMLALAARARWAGLPARARGWTLAALCAGERFLSLMRTGVPADLGWSRACALLAEEAPELALAWGHSAWRPSEAGLQPPLALAGRIFARPAAGALAQAGQSLRKAVQVSLMEGRPVSERIESSLAGLRQELRAQVARELTLLPSRALQPLFLCVAPALLVLLGSALWIALLGSGVLE